MEAIQLMKYRGARKLLETLIKFPNRQFTINELAKEAGVPFASTWRLVRKWEPAGLIETGRVGRSVTVKLHRSEYLDSVLSLLNISKSPQVFTANALVDLLAKEKKVKEAYLFGSVASGNEKIISDIDIALLVEKDFDANSLVFRVYEKYGTKIVPITFLNKKELKAFMADKKGERLK
ncbi:MAG: nucleotidyltransferase domain-containing protein [Candidatus Micrarchaeota archaeon]